jgi:hypothetical protein
MMTQWFFLRGSLACQQASPHCMIHSLGGSRANRHHTSNPQPSAAQPTQDEDPQAMRNPPELPLALHRGRHKNPAQAQWSEPVTITNSRSMIHQPPGCLGVGKHQE